MTFTYDDYSNRATKSVQTGGTTTYTYDANNRLLKESTINGSVTSVTNYGYDNNGNQITTWDEEEEANGTGTPSAHLEIIGEDTEPKATYNVYNGFNQLVKTNTGNIRAEYTYNADGLRTTKTVNGAETRHIWSGANIIFEMSSTDEVQYIRGINLICMDDGTTESFYMFNAHGDVVHLTIGSTGAITKDYTYDAFGIEENPDSADQNPFRYCGEYFDKCSNTYYLRARYYSPNIGRFISEDSYWGSANDQLSLNLYIYCANNPVIFVDPSGRSLLPEIQAAERHKDEIAVLEADRNAPLTLVKTKKISVLQSVLDNDRGGAVITGNPKNTGPGAIFRTADIAAKDFVMNNSAITYKGNRETGTYILEFESGAGTYYTYNDSYLGMHDNVVLNAVGEFLAYFYLSIKNTNDKIVLGKPTAFVHTHPSCICHRGEEFSTQDVLLYDITGIDTIYLGTPKGYLYAYEGGDRLKPRTVSSSMPVIPVVYTNNQIIR